jgi:hypothetical protein
MPPARALRAIQLGRRGDMEDHPRTPGNPSGKAGSSEPQENGSPGPFKTDLKHTGACRLLHGRQSILLTSGPDRRGRIGSIDQGATSDRS